MYKKVIIGCFCLLICAVDMSFSFAADDDTDIPAYTTLREIDKGTFNEYRYKITEKYFLLREYYKIEGSIDTSIAQSMMSLIDTGYKYLPDNLQNKNYYNTLITELKRGIKYPDSDASYSAIVKAIEGFLEETQIGTVSGSIEVLPSEGNAPLTVTLRAKINDPTGSQIPSYNYIWWVDNGGRREIITRNVFASYVFREEGEYAIFLDVVSNHKNAGGFTDVLPFSSRVNITVKEKVASLIIKVNSETLNNQEVLKFTPEEGSYGIVFDATSSIPTSGAKFISTKWDFGNGVIKTYNTGPRVERVVYKNEGEYTATLTLTTNELKVIERTFIVSVHKPIASISSSKEQGHMGDQITFVAKPSGNAKNLSYEWEIVDIANDKVLLKKTGSVFSYTFLDKGDYNIRLKVTEASGETDMDTKIITIESRPPVANFSYTIPKSNNPNTVLLDGSMSFDPDYSDEGKLDFSWVIDGQKVLLENSSGNGSLGYYSFDSIGEHSVGLQVTDPDSMTSVKNTKVRIDSILSVDVSSVPRVIQREQFVKFMSESERAKFYEWDFGDGDVESGKMESLTHSYAKSGVFDAKLTVRDDDGNSNTAITKVYVSESDSPYAFLKLSQGENQFPIFDQNACNGEGGYIVNRVEPITFDANESINIDGQTLGIGYSWKIGNDKYATTPTLNHTFDDLGCIPVKLTVTSNKNGKSHSSETMVSVTNMKPVLSSLQIDVVDASLDPIVVNVSAIGASDKDGVIQSYLWYYYTDVDSEPQDFRATSRPGTTFVLPKISGNYYFVLVMKDNNEERVSSEEATGSKFFTTLTGDNINTPIIDFRVNDSSVAIGEELVFTVIAKNVLGDDISKNAEYFWDFDGDGFYEKTTKESTVTYVYANPGDYLAKVKVKHKGFTNTRNVAISVSNPLTPDFDYISIGSKFIFLSKSTGKIDSIKWDLGDNNKVNGNNSFTHIYTDGKTSHNVKLTISEGTKVKEITKMVQANVKNILKSRKEGINVFTSPEYDDKGIITLSGAHEKVYVYLGDSLDSNVASYVVDYDTSNDSNLNGGTDDDEDNKGLPSYKDGSAFEIPLTKSKEQKIRLMLKDAVGVMLDSYDITILKTYIEVSSINLDEVIFEGVTAEEKAKIDELKAYITALPQEYRLEGMNYIQKLQGEWYDQTEKVKVILEFESFLDNPGITNSADIIDLLESILVLGQQDKSEKNIAFNALKALIPDNLVCSGMSTGSGSACKDMIIAELEKINVSSDIEANKTIGVEILKTIEFAEGMTDKEKLDFKAVLKTFVYGGVSSIPEDEQQAVKDETDTSSGGGIMGVLLWILYILAAIICLFFGIVLIFWLYYKVTNDEEDLSFQDFILQKTSSKHQDIEDILSNDNDNENDKKDIQTETSFDTFEPKESEKTEDSDINTVNKTVESVPDWLRGATSSSSIPETNIDDGIQESIISSQSEEKIQTVHQESVPSWLKGTNDTLSVHKEDMSSIDSSPPEKESDDTIQTLTNIDELKVPDWLKGSIDTEENLVTSDPDMSKKGVAEETLIENTDKVGEEEGKIEQENVSDTQDIGLNEDLHIPDWLKGSINNEKTVQKTDKKPPHDKKKLETSKRTSKPVDKKEEGKSKDKESSPQDDLWKDGMEVPSWLQGTNISGDDKKNK